MWVRQAFDGAAIAEVAVDDAESLAQKLEQAIRCFADRPAWLPTYKRIEILRRLARLMERGVLRRAVSSEFRRAWYLLVLDRWFTAFG